eukprot:363897-Chlamydomonas_euryale.AAC.8
MWTSPGQALEPGGEFCVPTRTARQPCCPAASLRHEYMPAVRQHAACSCACSSAFYCGSTQHAAVRAQALSTTAAGARRDGGSGC